MKQIMKRGSTVILPNKFYMLDYYLFVQLLYRSGVSRLSPEGTSWDFVSLDDEEVQAVAAGPSGMLWVITWAGTLLARTGVSWQNPTGKLSISDLIKQSLFSRNTFPNISIFNIPLF